MCHAWLPFIDCCSDTSCKRLFIWVTITKCSLKLAHSTNGIVNNFLSKSWLWFHRSTCWFVPDPKECAGRMIYSYQQLSPNWNLGPERSAIPVTAWMLIYLLRNFNQNRKLEEYAKRGWNNQKFQAWKRRYIVHKALILRILDCLQWVASKRC